MKTQPTAPPPSTTTAATIDNADYRVAPDPIDPGVAKQSEENRQRLIAIGKHLLSYEDLKKLRDDLEEFPPYWRGIRKAVSSSVGNMEGHKYNAEQTLKELAALTRPLSAAERNDKANAEEMIERVTWRLKRDRVRLAAAEGQIKFWEEKKAEWDKTGKQRFRELTRQENDRRDVQRRNRESNW